MHTPLVLLDRPPLRELLTHIMLTAHISLIFFFQLHCSIWFVGVGASCRPNFLFAEYWVWWTHHLWQLQQISQQLRKVSELLIRFITCNQQFVYFTLSLSFFLCPPHWFISPHPPLFTSADLLVIEKTILKEQIKQSEGDLLQFIFRLTNVSLDL